MSDNSAKPILIAGAVGTVALLGVAWNFASNVSEQAVLDAQQFASENSSPLVAEVATMPEDPALPEPEAEDVAAVEETEGTEAEAAEEAEPEMVAEAEAATPEMVVGTAPRTVEEKPTEEPEVAEIKVVPAEDEETTEVAEAEQAPAEEVEAEAPAEEAAPEETEVAEAEEAAPAEPEVAVTAEAAPAETEVAEAAEAEEAAPAETAAPAAAATQVASIDGDAKAGKRVWRKCQACHKLGDGAKNAVGPQLNNIIGRTIGGIEDYKYSDGFIALRDEGKVWTVEALDAWLLKPRDYIAGTKMAFGGLRKEDDRKNVIAYMNEEGQ